MNPPKQTPTYTELLNRIAAMEKEQSGPERSLAKKYEVFTRTIAERDRLVALLIDELRNPLNNLINFSDLLAEELDKKEYPEARVYVRVMRDTAENIYRMLNLILEWSSAGRHAGIFLNQQEYPGKPDASEPENASVPPVQVNPE